MDNNYINNPQSIFDSRAAFIRELEITKHKLEIKPRKVNIMQSQVGLLQDFCADTEAKRKIYIPNKGGFI